MVTFGENIPSANDIAQNTIYVCNKRNPWLLQHDDTAFFLVGKLAISSHLQAMNCEMMNF